MADLIYMAKSKWRELLDTIRTKGGTSAPMTADQAIAAVEAIETGGGGLPAPISQYATGTFTLASDTTKLMITHGIDDFPSILYIFPDFNFNDFRESNKSITASYLYNNANVQAYYLRKIIYETSGNILSQCHEPLADNFKGDTATISFNDTYPFPAKWHRVDGDDGETITWRWVAIRFA